ncbi:methyl-accepting chemotaxis protein [Roseospira marina]|nr:methyl-accepting chemotaxis protein [Roseospira marina]MBB4312173.1 methyl-accepting chemotaxis protein [Roseospira marina]MBB5085811.1 methyl-accepting chemotaxis protein [Roseospira marina]
MRRAEADFLLRRDPLYAEAVRSAVTAAREEVQTLTAHPQAAAIRDDVDAVEVGLTEYAGVFDRLTTLMTEAGLDENAGAQGTLRAAVHEAEDVLEETDASRDLVVSMLMLRRHEKDFLLRGDPKYLERAETEYQTFLDTLAADPGAPQGRIRDVMETYIVALRAMVQARLEVVEADARLNETYDAFAPSIGRIGEYGAAKAREQGALREALGSRVKLAVAVLALIGLAVAAVVAFVIARATIGPIRAITQVMVQLSAGRRDVAVPFTDLRNELGHMAQAVETFKAGLIEAERLQQSALDTAKADVERARRRDETVAQYDTQASALMARVQTTVERVHGAAQKLEAAATRSGERGSAVASAATEAATNIQTVASATDELSATTGEISARVQDSSGLSRRAVDAIGAARQTVDRLQDTADNIGTVVALIQAIAAQTNLLALNATIEAARAGEAGRGFAVVAGEVKDLASQTGRATGDIQAQVEGIQGITRTVAESIGQSTKEIEQLSEVVGSIAAAVEQQNAATQEIARNVREVAGANDVVTESMSAVRDDTEATWDLAVDLSSAADDLKEEAGTMHTETDRFLTTIRSI